MENCIFKITEFNKANRNIPPKCRIYGIRCIGEDTCLRFKERKREFEEQLK